MQAHKRVNEAMAKYAGSIGCRNTPKCPICNSTNIALISTTAKVVNVAMFGLLGQKR